MKALIVVNAYICNKSQISQAERIEEELTALGVDCEVKKNFNLSAIDGQKITAGGYDFCVYLDKDRVSARLLEGAGLRLFNSAEAIEVCDDKMLTNVALTRCGFPVPDAIYAPLCYNQGAKADKKFLKDAAEFLHFPLVAKQNFGSLGAGVSLVKNMEELVSYEQTNLHLPHFYQKFIDCGAGEDTRVIVIGGKFVCAMKRRNEKDFRSNIELGGKGSKIEPDADLVALCEDVAQKLGLDYCGIDILTDKFGKRWVCEVNSNAFFAAAERVCGVNVAKLYALHIIESLKN